MKKNEIEIEIVHCTGGLVPRLPPVALHVAEHQLEPIAQGLHVRVRVLLQLVALRNHLDGPVLETRLLTRLETKEEVAGVFGIDAESIRRATRVGLGISLEPLVWK